MMIRKIHKCRLFFWFWLCCRSSSSSICFVSTLPVSLFLSLSLFFTVYLDKRRKKTPANICFSLCSDSFIFAISRIHCHCIFRFEVFEHVRCDQFAHNTHMSGHISSLLFIWCLLCYCLRIWHTEDCERDRDILYGNSYIRFYS